MDPTTQMGGSTVPPAALQVNVEDIRRSFYDEFAQGERYWWFDRELLADPWEFIVSDLDSGQLYRVPFTPEEDANGDTAVSEWGEPEPIKIKYVEDVGAKNANVNAAVRLAAPRLEKAGTLLAVNTTGSPRKAERQKKEAKPEMGIDINAVRALTGLSAEDLPDDASEDDINAALATANEEKEEEGAKPVEASAPSLEDARKVIEASGQKVVDGDVWDRTKTGAELAHKQALEGRKSDDGALLEATVKRGALLPSAKDKWAAKLAGPGGDHNGPDREQIREYLSKLEGGLVPVDELGTTQQEQANAQMGTGLFNYDKKEG
jgi:hypothetical protein